ncbi:MAG: hypothetical protein AAF602_30810, partial [Myxococcota bacterium]
MVHHVSLAFFAYGLAASPAAARDVTGVLREASQHAEAGDPAGAASAYREALDGDLLRAIHALRDTEIPARDELLAEAFRRLERARTVDGPAPVIDGLPAYRFAGERE